MPLISFVNAIIFAPDILKGHSKLLDKRHGLHHGLKQCRQMRRSGILERLFAGPNVINQNKIY